MRSLTLKVILAFVVVCLVQALIVAVLVRDSTRQSFDRFVEEEALRIFTEDVVSYYEANGSLDGLSAILARNQGRPSRPPKPADGERPSTGGEPRRGGPPIGREPERGGPGRAGPEGRRPGQGGPSGGLTRARRGPIYGFADSEGEVVISNGKYRVGEVLAAEVIKKSRSVDISPGYSGYILEPGIEPVINPEARAFLDKTDNALGIALGGGFLIALLIGALFARTYMKPLRELTAATQELSKGTTHKPIEVRTRDEIGLLTDSFNQMVAELDRVNQSRKQMTADIAHELRSPLGILTGYLEAFQGGDLQPSPERLKTMFSEAKHLERLIEDLRVLALADAGELQLYFKEVSVKDLLLRASSAFEQAAAEHSVEVKVEESLAIPSLRLDEERMMQVLNNLIGNALRYTSSEGSIILSVHTLGNQVELRVEDTGSGIPSASLPHIFERFYKVDSSRSNHLETSGLGLPIAKSIVEAHRGSIEIVSEEGRGTTVSILLPLE
ncbi:MAG: HAMP domain-containing protein [Rhodothermaceae bacterium]|nr:HAMP domain-containing protein [Rhodothermaceae bacterium]